MIWPCPLSDTGSGSILEKDIPGSRRKGYKSSTQYERLTCHIKFEDLLLTDRHQKKEGRMKAKDQGKSTGNK